MPLHDLAPDGATAANGVEKPDAPALASGNLAGIRPILAGHRSLIVGIANDQSIAYGCAVAFRGAGAELAITWLNDKARPHVEPLGAQLGAEILAPLNVETPGEMEAVFDE